MDDEVILAFPRFVPDFGQEVTMRLHAYPRKRGPVEI
jgi:hypothetical protein